GALSILAGILLLSQPQLVLRGLALFVGASFLIDGIGKIVVAMRARPSGAAWKWTLLCGLVNCALALVLVSGWPIYGGPIVVIVVGVRMLTVGWSMLLGRAEQLRAATQPPPRGLHPDRRLGLGPHPEFVEIEDAQPVEDASQRRINAFWCWNLFLVFF